MQSFVKIKSEEDDNIWANSMGPKQSPLSRVVIIVVVVVVVVDIDAQAVTPCEW